MPRGLRRRRRSRRARHRSAFRRRETCAAICSSSAATPSSRDGKMSESSPVMVKALRSRAAHRSARPRRKRRVELVEPLPERHGDRRAPRRCGRPPTRATFRCAPPTSKPAMMFFPFATLQAFMTRRTNAGRSVAYHSGSRLERRRGGARRARASATLPADRDAAQRHARPGRGRRGAAHAASVSDLLHRRSRRDRGPRRRTTPRSPGCAPCRSAPELWVDAGVADAKTLAAALAEPVASARCSAPNRSATTRLLRRFRDHPASSCRSISSPTAFAARRPSSTSPTLWPRQRDRHDAGQGRLRRRPGFRAAGRRSRQGPATAPSSPPAACATRPISARWRRSASPPRWSPPRCTTARSPPRQLASLGA